MQLSPLKLWSSMHAQKSWLGLQAWELTNAQQARSRQTLLVWLPSWQCQLELTGMIAAAYYFELILQT